MATWEKLHETVTVAEPHERLMEFVEGYLKPGMRILDQGCGKGRHSLYCAKRGIEAHAVDLADVALDYLRNEAEKDQLFEKLKVTKSDIREMPFPDDYFDAIISVNVINHGHWKDVKGYFKEATRVLRPGGLYFLLCLPMEALAEAKGPKSKELEKGTFIELDTPDNDVPHHFLTREEIKELLEDYDILKMENYTEFNPWSKRPVTHVEIIARKNGKQD